MKTPLAADETIVKSGPANLQRGPETVGGRLCLTSRRLIFESHAFNARRGETEILLSDLASVANCWTKLFNIFPILENSLAVTTSQGKEHRFVLFGREKWAAAITSARAIL